MDIVAHSLWAGLAALAAAERWPVSRGQAVGAVALAALPDIAHALPIAVWVASGDGPWTALTGYVFATPRTEPWLPPGVAWWSHTLHCVMHSALIAAALSALSWFAWRRGALLPLAGWWSHIVIDVFTHSRDYYASPVLYPITERGFDGVAWTTPWFAALNYAALAAAGGWLVRRRRAQDRS